MNKVKIADLKNNLSRYLAYVREGGEVLVLDRDTPVARLVPFAEGGRGRATAKDRQAEGRLAELERQGVIRRGDPRAVREWLGAGEAIALPDGASVVRTLLEMRDEDAR